MAELGSMSGRRGEAGGHGNGERWRRLRSGALGEERTREEGEREGGEKDWGGAWRRSRHPDEEGRGRQAGELVAWRGGARARRAHSPPSVEDEDDRGGGGLGRLLAGPACCCWARGARQKPR